jgi:hypothetical protein
VIIDSQSLHFSSSLLSVSRARVASRDYVRFIDTPLCVYTGSGDEKQHEDYIRVLLPYQPFRALLPYQPLKERPW